MMTLTWLMLLILWCWNSEYQSWWWRWWWWRCWSLSFSVFIQPKNKTGFGEIFPNKAKLPSTQCIHISSYNELKIIASQQKVCFLLIFRFFISGCYLFDQIFKYIFCGVSAFSGCSTVNSMGDEGCQPSIVANCVGIVRLSCWLQMLLSDFDVDAAAADDDDTNP